MLSVFIGSVGLAAVFVGLSDVFLTEKQKDASELWSTRAWSNLEDTKTGLFSEIPFQLWYDGMELGFLSFSIELAVFCSAAAILLADAWIAHRFLMVWPTLPWAALLIFFQLLSIALFIAAGWITIPFSISVGLNVLAGAMAIFELTMRRISEYKKGPIVAGGILLTTFAALLKFVS